MTAPSRRHLLKASAAGLLALPAVARAAYPERPLRIISPYPPGGGTDVTSRVLSASLTARLGQPIVVENRPGAAGAIGAAEVARAAPDGYTLLVDALGHAVNPSLLRGLAFDYATAFAPISQLNRLPQIMIAPIALPPATLAEFIAYARARPGALAYGSSGNGTGSHLATVLFLGAAGLSCTHVPYRGGSTAMQAVLAGEVAFAFATVNTASALIRDGRLRAYALAGDARIAAFPDLPTFAEAGHPGCEIYEWKGLFAPAGTPAAVIERLHGAFAGALGEPEVRARFAAIGAEPLGTTPAAFTAFVAAQRATMANIIRTAGITAE